MRPGRLDRLVYVGPPDRQGREDILRIRLRKMSVGPDVHERMTELADAVSILWQRCGRALVHCNSWQAEGCSGAEIVALCQEAAMMTMRENMQSPYVGTICRFNSLEC